MKPLRILLLYGASAANATFSYQQAWPQAFQNHPRFQCTRINLLDRRWPARVAAAAVAATWRGDAVVLLHSVFSNACLLSGRLFDLIRRVPQPKAFFIGNEYKLMPEKMRFCERLQLGLLVSQSLSPDVHALYHRRLGCRVTGITNTGLDQALFTSKVPVADRPIDVGYRADDSPPYLGHQERRTIAEFFTTNAERYRLTADISLKAESRFDEPGWAAFLNRCKAQLGTEAGGDYFDLEDTARLKTMAYLKAHPGAGFDEIYDHCLRDRQIGMPLRILSGRNVEAAGTGTVQILFEGHYDGFFVADEHYIPLKKDFSNADEAVAKFRDAATRDRIARNALQVAREELTYERLLGRFETAIAPLL
jgi:hypothetical protein